MSETSFCSYTPAGSHFVATCAYASMHRNSSNSSLTNFPDMTDPCTIGPISKVRNKSIAEPSTWPQQTQHQYRWQRQPLDPHINYSPYTYNTSTIAGACCRQSSGISSQPNMIVICRKRLGLCQMQQKSQTSTSTNPNILGTTYENTWQQTNNALQDNQNTMPWL